MNRDEDLKIFCKEFKNSAEDYTFYIMFILEPFLEEKRRAGLLKMCQYSEYNISPDYTANISLVLD